MIANASLFQMSGGGYNYENFVQSSFLISMILETNIPTFPTGKITEIAFQCKNKGYETDDLFLKVQHNELSRVLIQIKYNVIISEKNEIFFDVIDSFWKDFNNEDIFDKANDKFFLIKSSLTNDDKNHIITLTDWASTHSSEEDFYSEVDRIKIKKDKLKVFESLLKRANGDVEVSRKSVWEFLNCFHLLVYDFANQGSLSESNFLNLIKISKNKQETTKSTDIWNACLVKCSEYNRNGGSITSNNISNLDLHKFFNLSLISDIQVSIKKLEDDGRLVIKPFKSNVEGYHVSRHETKREIISSIINSKITFITGSPGVGKSAILKEIILEELKKSFTLIFKADQFNKSTIAQVFTDIGVTHNLQDIFNAISLHQNKFIVVDSAEKLLEGDPDNAFRQLISSIEEINDLHLVLTSRSYAVNVILQKFAMNKESVNVINIPQFTNTELDEIQKNFPVLEPLLNNWEIKKILFSPKYLELALISIKGGEVYSNKLTVSDFKGKLWNQIIENSSVVRGGIARKRRKTFMHIAIGRATEMSLFFRPDDSEIDFEALDGLISDEVIINNQSNDEFSPSHDILEDWALIKHIEFLQRDINNKGDLFNALGNQPALRRAFRLWVEEILISDIDSIINLVKETLINNQIERYWVDEILTAIFRSEECNDFFNLIKDDLLKENTTFLNRCILIIRTTCREYSLSNIISKEFLFPVGSGWQEVLDFISKNINELDEIRSSIIGLLLDWEIKYLFKTKECSEIEIESSCKIILHFIFQMENIDDFWSSHEIKQKKNQLIDMLWGFSDIATKDIHNLLNRCNDRTNENGGLYGFDETLVKKALGGLRNTKLVKELPKTLIGLADKHWKHTPPPKGYKNEDSFGFDLMSRKDRKDSWGMQKYGFDFFPAGVYKTFVYDLFRTHPTKAIVFIVDFINYMTMSYNESDYANKDDLKEIEVQNNDNVLTTQFGNITLWCAYRGTTVTHDLLQSILSSFEKYLLELVEIDVKENKLLKSITNYCLTNSKSVATTSVLVSVFIAKPKPFGDTILPVLRTEEFYKLDFYRAIREYSALEIADSQIPFAQNEKWKSNQLPHRRKYTKGLSSFIIDYQFNIAELNEQIFEIFDGFYKNCNEDIFWKKTINEMDRRKYEPTIIDKEKGLIQLEVTYPEEVVTAVEDFTKNRKDEETSISFSAIIDKTNKGEHKLTFEKWSELFSHFSSNERTQNMFDKPVSFAVIGLNQFADKLTDIPKNWCLTTIIETIQKISKYIFLRGWAYGNDIGFNIIEQELATQSIHLLYKNISDKKSVSEIDLTVSYLLICPMADHERRSFHKYYRNDLSKIFPKKVRELNLAIINYSGFISKNKRPFHQDSNELIKFGEKEFKFLKKTLESKLIINIENLNFENYNASFLINGLLVMSPKTNDDFEKKYILKLTSLILEELKLEGGNPYGRGRREQRKIDYNFMVDLRFYFNQVLLYNSFDFTHKIIDSFFSSIHGEDANDDILKFISEILDVTITLFDDVIVANDKNEIQKYGNQFWSIWQYLFDKIKNEQVYYFYEQLLLDAEGQGWSIKSNNWKGFMDKKPFYESMIEYFGILSMKPLVNVFSSFGEHVFLPEGISWIVLFLKKDKSNFKFLNSPNAVKLIESLFNNHITQIKQNQKLVSDFIFILNTMVNLGYSEAYLIRECVIIYKKSIK